jgi:hypothetical protein
LAIDSATGIFTLDTYAVTNTIRSFSFDVKVDVVTTDGFNDEVLELEGTIAGAISGPDDNTGRRNL